MCVLYIITTANLAASASAMSSNQRNRYNAADPQTPDCQDWTPVMLSKSKPTSMVGSYKDAAAAASATKNSASAVVAAITAKSNTGTDADDNTKKTKYIAKVTSDAIRNARCEKKLTQKELAQKCNMDASIVSEIERGGGTCVYNATHVNKIQSVLGVKIPRA